VSEFKDPFEQLGKKKLSNEFEDVEGTLMCEATGCYKVSFIGRYNEAKKFLTWRCPDGHDNSIDGIEL
jgi:hypothetical protein